MASKQINHFTRASILLFLLSALPLSSVFAQVKTQNEARPELVLQGGHSGSVAAVAFSPDGRLLAQRTRPDRETVGGRYGSS